SGNAASPGCITPDGATPEGRRRGGPPEWLGKAFAFPAVAWCHTHSRRRRHGVDNRRSMQIKSAVEVHGRHPLHHQPEPACRQPPLCTRVASGTADRAGSPVAARLATAEQWQQPVDLGPRAAREQPG
ncbi:unnamed protein product, partial [Phaeothamnion confervicola]